MNFDDPISVVYDNSIDVWSYGVVLYFMLYGYTIRGPSDVCSDSVIWDNVIDFSKNYPETDSEGYKNFNECMNFIKKILVFDPKKRLSFGTILSDPFYK